MWIHQITEYMENTCKRIPNEMALQDDSVELTFAELRLAALRLALRINKALRGEVRKIVAVWLPKSAESVIADLAISYAACAYMNLDINNPLKRIQSIDKRVRPDLYLALADNLPPLQDAEARCLVIEKYSPTALKSEEIENALKLTERIIDTDLYCLINTSGSTGEPKTVALSHRGFIDLIEAAKEAGIAGNRENIGSLAPIIFDHHSFEICMLQAYGSKLSLIPAKLAAFPVRLLEYLAQHNVSFIFWVPTIMVNIANLKLLEKIPLPSLKVIWFAGEVFPVSQFNYWRRQLSGLLFVNLYGPTEISVDCLYYVASSILKDTEIVPTGKPFPNTDVFLLKEDDTLAQTGEIGEICVRGSSLALGYYNFPEKTETVFTQNPLNKSFPETIYRTGDLAYINAQGQFMYKGRKDTLIKHQGYRIELGEIEHAANISGLIHNSCVLYDSQAKKIILVYQADREISPRELHQALGELLPRYALPAAYEWLREMPMNTNGKIDRAGLKQKYIKK